MIASRGQADFTPLPEQDYQSDYELDYEIDTSDVEVESAPDEDAVSGLFPARVPPGLLKETGLSTRREIVRNLLSPSRCLPVVELSLVSLLSGKTEIVRVDSPLVVIGRGSQCDLRLMHPEISRRHACLHVLSDRVLWVDLASRTGVFCGDQRLPAGWLDSERPVRIGPFELRLNSPAVSSVARIEPEQMFARISDGEPGEPVPGLRLLSRSNEPEREIPLARPITLIGRGSQCKLRLKDESVSKVHSSLMVTPEGVWAVNLQGRGGVKVNGELIARALLTPGDVLEIGRYRMQYVSETSVRSQNPDASSDDDQTSDEFPPHQHYQQQFYQSPPAGFVSEAFVLAMTETFADMQRQLHDQFRLQMDLMAGLLHTVNQELHSQVKADLARVLEIGSEIRDAQRQLLAAPPAITDADRKSDVAKSGTDKKASAASKPASRRSRPSRAGEEVNGDGIAAHAVVTHRLRELERERNRIWSRLSRVLRREN